MALRRVMFLALFSCTLATEAQQLPESDSSDEVSALQVAVNEKAKTTQTIDGIELESAPESSSLSCPDMDLNMNMAGSIVECGASGARKAAQQMPTAPDAWKGMAPPSPKAAEEEAVVESSELVDEAAPTTFLLRYCLQLLVIGVIADGLRRWRQSDGGANSTSKSASVVSVSVANSGKTATADERAALFAAVQAGDAKACKALLAGGVPATGEDASGGTLLHAAVKNGSVAVVALLLQKGAKVDALDAWDDAPLHLAAQQQQSAKELCDLLIKHGAKVDALNAQEWTPLVVAGSAGKKAVCEFLLARGATQGDVKETSLPPMLRLLLQGEEEETEESEPEVVEKQSFDVKQFAM